MPESNERKKLSEEVAEIDSQLAALAKLKQKHLAKPCSPASAIPLTQ